jgi:molybdate transport system substrate-binding protein
MRIAAAVILFAVMGQAQEPVRLLAPRGIRDVVTELVPGFEKATGFKVEATFTSGGDVTARVVKGEAFDVVILHPPYGREVESGNLTTLSATELASAVMGMAVKQGAEAPDVHTSKLLKRELLRARSIAVPGLNGATAGPIFDGVMKKLKITRAVRKKIRLVESGDAAMEMVAKGEAEIGLTYLSEMGQAGITAGGAFPAELAPPNPYVGLIATGTWQLNAARALLDYLASRDAAEVYTRHRMVKR